MKKILYITAAIAILWGCSKDSTPNRFRDELFVDSEHVVAQGSYVQGAVLNEHSVVEIPYQNAKGGTAIVSAPQNNGISIAEQSVTMANGQGNVTVKVTGTPIKLENTYLQLNIRYANKVYISSAEIPVMMDADPNGSITFTIDNSEILSLGQTQEIPFTVSPTMAAVVLSSTPLAGLAVKIEQDMAAGSGKVILTPSTELLSGTIELTATFGVRDEQSCQININGFDSGDGTDGTPYSISTPNQFAKLAYGVDKSYILSENLTLGAISPLAGLFAGKLDGNSKYIDFSVNTPTADNAALFASLTAAARVSNLTLKGAVTGQDNVAALAAVNSGATTTAIDASAVVVTGRNNVALLSASGTGKDGSVITFTNTPTTINITQGNATGKVALGITPKGSAVEIDLKSTGLKAAAYSPSTGELTLTMPDNAADFTSGDIIFSTKLAAMGAGSNVNALPRTLSVKSEKMYEGGTGVQADPYTIKTIDQLSATMTAYPGSYIKLAADLEASSWSTITAFTGTLDGAGSKISRLNNPFVATLSGTISNIAFTQVALTSSATGNFGVVANISSGTITKTAVTGTLTRTTSGGDQPTGALVGEMSGGSISNCYINVEMSVSGNHAGGIAGRSSNSAATKSISRCTTEGKLTASAGTAFGGIMGRIVNGSGAVTITNCHSSMVVSATGSTSNMVGGVFGASQPSTANTYKIDQCMFSGRIDATAAGAGISGVGCRISNSIVVGSGSEGTAAATVRSGGDANNYPGAGINASVKDNISNCIVATARIASINTDAVSNRNTAGICTDRNANTPTVSGCVLYNVSLPTFGRAIVGNNTALTATFGAVTNNYHFGLSYYADATPYIPTGVATIDGTAITTPLDQAWYEGIGYDFTSVWRWSTTKGHPELQSVGCDTSVKPQ